MRKKLCLVFSLTIFALFINILNIQADEYSPFGRITNIGRNIQGANKFRLDMIETVTLDMRREGMSITGDTPLISPDFYQSYALLNEKISIEINALIDTARRLQPRPRSIDIGFESYLSGRIVSIVIYATISTTVDRDIVTSINFDSITGDILSLRTALGIDIIPITSQLMHDRVRRNPERYSGVLAIDFNKQPFYLSDNILVILFDGFQISSAVRDISRINVNLGNIRSMTLSPEQYNEQGGYGILMIPIRLVLEELGFEVSESDDGVEIDFNGTLIRLEPNVNKYYLGQTDRTLELAPILIDNILYVPVTFFSEILSFTTFNIDNKGYITFLTYINRPNIVPDIISDTPYIKDVF